MIPFGFTAFTVFIACLLTLFLVILIFSVVRNPSIPGLLFLLSLLGLVFSIGLAQHSEYPVGEFVQEKWRGILLGVLLYLVVGVSWSLYKWYGFSINARRDLREWLKAHPILVQVPGETEQDFSCRLQAYALSVPNPVTFNKKTHKFELLASEHKETILIWMSLWPLSLLRTLVEDLVLRMWENLYRFFSGLYQRISDRIFSGINP